MARFSALLLFAGSLCVCSAQNTAELSSHDAPTTFSTRVNLVMVPVVVRDKQGHAIGTYQKEDFLLFDKGKPQVITKFSVEKAGGKAIRIQSGPADNLGGEKPADTSLIPTHFIAYLFDDLHLSFGDLVQARTAASRQLAESLQPADRAAILTTSGQAMQDFTDDQAKLQETLLRIQPRSRQTPTGVECPDIPYYMADLIQNKNDTAALQVATAEALFCPGMDPNMPGAQQLAQAQAQSTAARVVNIGDADTQVSLRTLLDMVRRISAMPGQRTLVLVSPGFVVPDHLRASETDILDRAIRSSVTVSTLDARGLYTIIPGGDASQRNFNSNSAIRKAQYVRESALAEGDILGELADGTGGIYFHNSNDLTLGFRRVAASPEFVYILGFSPQNLKYNGSFHSLKVTLRNTRETALQARHGYYAPKHEADPAEDAKQEIAEALFSREEMNDIPVELQMQFFKPTDVTARLAVVARVNVRQLRYRKVEGRNNDILTIVSGVFDRNGNFISAIQKTIEMRLKDETLETKLNGGITIKTSFDVTPGNFVVRLVVRDAEGQMMAARNGVVQIP